MKDLLPSLIIAKDQIQIDCRHCFMEANLQYGFLEKRMQIHWHLLVIFQEVKSESVIGLDALDDQNERILSSSPFKFSSSLLDLMRNGFQLW